jgi:sporulation protein YlmC with PRC-barrel domain
MAMHRPTIELCLGAAVRTSDNHRLGTVDRIIIDRSSRRVSEIVVHDGRFDAADVIVPVERIVSVLPDAIDLNMTAHEIATLPAFSEEAFVPLESQDIAPLITWEGPPDYEPRPVMIPASALYTPRVMPFAPQLVVERKGTPPNSADLVAGTQVFCRDGLLGTVRELLVESGSAVADAVVVESYGHPPTQWEIPVDELYVGEDGNFGLRRNRSDLGRFVRRLAS